MTPVVAGLINQTPTGSHRMCSKFYNAMLCQSFPRKERLRRKEFKEVFSHGKRCGDGILTVYGLKLIGDERKAGFVVRRAIRQAVERNRLKRLLRELYRLHRDRLAEGIAIVVVISERARGLRFKELEKSFLPLLNRISIL